MFRHIAIGILLLHNAATLPATKHDQPSRRHKTTRSLEELANYFEDERNAMIAVTEHEDNYLLNEDFYEEMDSRPNLYNSMNMIFFGPSASFMRIDTETILHILQYTQRYKIPITRALLAWDMVTDGKTSAFLQGREFLAFGPLLNVIPEEELYYANFGEKSVINYFANHNAKLNVRKLGILVASYKRYYGDNWYKNGSFINELGYMLCGLPSYSLERIPPVVFKDISVVTFSKLKACTVNQTKTLYNIATHPDAYGSPYKWTSFEVSKIGMLLKCVPAHLISSIQLEAVSAITQDVMRAIDQSKLEHFTRPQIMIMNEQTRRIYIIRMSLRSGYDMDLLLRE